MFSMPDFSKLQPMFEEALQLFKTLQSDIEQIKKQQAEILSRLSEKEDE